MTIDTSKDPRILIAEIAVYRLKDGLTQKLPFPVKFNKQKMQEFFKELHSHVQILKWSYQDNLKEQEATHWIVKHISEISDQIGTHLKRPGHLTRQLASVRWALNIFLRLPQRFDQPHLPELLGTGVDHVVVVVKSTESLPKTNLLLCRVSTGEEDFQVITNITSVKRGDVMPLAFVPPAVVGGVVSEAMFEGTSVPEGLDVGDFIPYQHPVSDVEAILREEIKQLAKKK